MMEIIENADALKVRLIELSGNGQAWAYHIKPFSHEVTFVAFASPSRVPDWYYDLMYTTDHQMGYRGRLAPFSKAAILREEWRGITGD